jgi:hypothetical protein
LANDPADCILSQYGRLAAETKYNLLIEQLKKSFRIKCLIRSLDARNQRCGPVWALGIVIHDDVSSV